MTFIMILASIFIRAALLGTLLMGAWNFGVTKFFTEAPQVGLLESFYVLFAYQALSLFLARPINREFVPIYLPMDSKDDVKND